MSYMKKQRNQNWGFLWIKDHTVPKHAELFRAGSSGNFWKNLTIQTGWESFVYLFKTCVSSWLLWPHLANFEDTPIDNTPVWSVWPKTKSIRNSDAISNWSNSRQKSNSNHLGEVIDFTHATSIGFYQTDLVDACSCIGCSRKKQKTGLKNTYIYILLDTYVYIINKNIYTYQMLCELPCKASMIFMFHQSKRKWGRPCFFLGGGIDLWPTLHRGCQSQMKAYKDSLLKMWCHPGGDWNILESWLWGRSKIDVYQLLQSDLLIHQIEVT